MIFSKVVPFNADTYTPVELYLSLRNSYRKTCLLESNDYHDRTNSKSFIGLNPIVEILVEQQQLILRYQGMEIIEQIEKGSFSDSLSNVLSRFDFAHHEVLGSGFFGRFGFEMALLTETTIVKKASSHQLPDVHLFLFETVLVIDHFSDNGYIIQHAFNQEDLNDFSAHSYLNKSPFTSLPFEKLGEEMAMFSDLEFAKIVSKAKAHCKRGDVFQLVVSNEFEQGFFGDDFQIYRQLRRLNPSPYLFYFDFESYRLLGSSPEAQLLVYEGVAEIHPIAGTVPKTAVKAEDDQRIQFLIHDEKENAEHTMLVDLARNDLSRDCSPVQVQVFKEIQSFSHVIHLVSKVVGQLKTDAIFPIINHSFPAGTLAGTPKPKALELISQFEPKTRDYYGGAIGYIGANKQVNLAIVIRSVLSKNNRLFYRAGAGVVLDSIVQQEVNEVHHKLKAVRKAIDLATEKEVFKLSN